MTKIQIELSDAQETKYRAWVAEQNTKAIKRQRIEVPTNDPFYEFYKECWDAGYPYGGAIGGELTWMITMTSIGTVVKVQSAFTNDILDLTDYKEW